MTKPKALERIEQPSVLLESVQYGSNLYLGSFSYVGEYGDR
jgi:hypothetical protein